MFAVIFLAALFLSFELLPSAKADEEVCLKIALPEMADHVRSAERYRAAMAEAGLCVQPVWLPNKRTAVSLKRGEIDGVFASGETINVSAMLSGGGIISTVFTLDNTFGFETLTFDASWTNLASVSFQNASGRIAYDNIVVDAPTVVSAPGPLAILGLGILGLGLARRNRAA